VTDRSNLGRGAAAPPFRSALSRAFRSRARVGACARISLLLLAATAASTIAPIQVGWNRLGPVSAHAAELPDPVGHVNDFADVLTPPVERRLESVLRAVAENYRVEVALLTMPDLGG
jgi:uncharacterized membrane protein YgcG